MVPMMYIGPKLSQVDILAPASQSRINSQVLGLTFRHEYFVSLRQVPRTCFCAFKVSLAGSIRVINKVLTAAYNLLHALFKSMHHRLRLQNT